MSADALILIAVCDGCGKMTAVPADSAWSYPQSCEPCAERGYYTNERLVGALPLVTQGLPFPVMASRFVEHA